MLKALEQTWDVLKLAATTAVSALLATLVLGGFMAAIIAVPVFVVLFLLRCFGVI